jgi:hypothetical protein
MTFYRRKFPGSAPLTPDFLVLSKEVEHFKNRKVNKPSNYTERSLQGQGRADIGEQVPSYVDAIRVHILPSNC